MSAKGWFHLLVQGSLSRYSGGGFLLWVDMGEERALCQKFLSIPDYPDVK